MVFEVLIPAIGTVIVALIVFAGKVLDNRTTSRDNDHDRLIARLDKTEAELGELRTKTDSDRLRISQLEGSLHDKNELLDDVHEIILWIQDGAKPPAPELSWRVRRWLDRPPTGENPQA